MSAYIRFVLRHRVAFIALIAVTVAISGWSASRIRTRFQFRDFYDYPGNKDLPTLNRYTDDFGDPAGNVILMIQGEDVFQPPVLEYIDTLTKDLESEKVYSHVHSLTNVKATHGSGDEVIAGPVIVQIPKTPAEVEAARKITLGSSLLRRRIVSEDSKTTVILAEMRTPAIIATVDEQRAANVVAQKTLERHPPPAGLYTIVTGAPTIEVGVTDTLLKDQMFLTPISMSLLILMLFLTFRSIHGIVLPLAAVQVASIWAAGIFPFFHRPIDMFGSTMPLTLLVYCVVDPIFVLSRYLQKIEAGRSREDAIVEALSELALPCFLTSLTTALGFAAFVTLKLPMFVSYGATVAVGVSLAWVTTMTVIPIMLSYLKPPARRLSGLKSAMWLDRLLARTWSVLRPRIPLVLGGAVVIIGAAAFFGREQHISTQYLEVLPASPAKTAVRLLEKKLTGISRTSVYIEGEPGVMKRPDVLRAIAAVDQFAEQPDRTLSSNAVSLADLLAEVNQAFHGGDPKEHRVPESTSLVAQYLSLLTPEERSDFVDEAYSKTHIRILSEEHGSEPYRALRGELQSAIDREFKGLPVKVTLTGYAAVAFQACDIVVIDMLYGFLTAFLIVVAFEFLLFRSLRIAVISILPNLLPVVVTFVLIRAGHIVFELNAGLFLTVCIGGLFNTTIHFATRVRQLDDAGGSTRDDIIENGMRTVGPPALYTAIILSSGFAVFLLSQFPGLRVFGLCAMASLLTGFFSDMIITAASLRGFYRWKTPADAVATSEPQVQKVNVVKGGH